MLSCVVFSYQPPTHFFSKQFSTVSPVLKDIGYIEAVSVRSYFHFRDSFFFSFTFANFHIFKVENQEPLLLGRAAGFAGERHLGRKYREDITFLCTPRFRTPRGAREAKYTSPNVSLPAKVRTCCTCFRRPRFSPPLSTPLLLIVTSSVSRVVSCDVYSGAAHAGFAAGCPSTAGSVSTVCRPSLLRIVT